LADPARLGTTAVSLLEDHEPLIEIKRGESRTRTPPIPVGKRARPGYSEKRLQKGGSRRAMKEGRALRKSPKSAKERTAAPLRVPA